MSRISDDINCDSEHCREKWNYWFFFVVQLTLALSKNAIGEFFQFNLCWSICMKGSGSWIFRCWISAFYRSINNISRPIQQSKFWRCKLPRFRLPEFFSDVYHTLAYCDWAIEPKNSNSWKLSLVCLRWVQSTLQYFAQLADKMVTSGL